jgi:hypothetical protein
METRPFVNLTMLSRDGKFIHEPVGIIMSSIKSSLFSAAAILVVSLSIAGCSSADGEVRPLAAVAAGAAASSSAFPAVQYFGEVFAETEKALQSKPVEPAAPTF